jgi:hypothetical protein
MTLTEPFSLTLRHPLPSWNRVLGLGHWQRSRLKKEIAADFLSALRASAADSSTRTTSAKNTSLIAADTLASYQRTAQALRESRSRKKRSRIRQRSAR